MNGWSADKKALHALNRLAFGPGPGDVEAVARQGVGSWIRRQMAPDSILDEGVTARLASLPTLLMSVAALEERFPRPRAVLAKAGIASDDPNARDKARELIPPGQRPQEIERQLVAAKLVRAVESRRQLQEVLTDFWFNHFNVFAGKGLDRWMVGPYERDAIRPNVFGNFRQLLGATAINPAMLFYLDNWSSVREGFDPKEILSSNVRRARRPDSESRAARSKLGLNENYARELLELHTLGVDGGYSQEDVREVARCFTGWSIARPYGGSANGPLARVDAGREPGTFVYRDAAHDKGEKHVLGEVIPAGGGREDGEKVLDLLARQPATPRFIATKLCRKFVVDDPSPALVRRVADTFQRTRGDLRSVYGAIFSSPEFWSDAAFLAKTKTPLELAVSGVRAMGGTVNPDVPPALAREIARMGEPLYLCQPPTGYKESADAWVNSGTLLNRMNFGIALAAGRVGGVSVDPARLAPGPASARVAGLLLGAPDFQRQ